MVFTFKLKIPPVMILTLLPKKISNPFFLFYNYTTISKKDGRGLIFLFPYFFKLFLYLWFCSIIKVCDINLQLCLVHLFFVAVKADLSDKAICPFLFFFF